MLSLTVNRHLLDLTWPEQWHFKLKLELELYISIAQIKHNKHIECALQYFQAYDNKIP